MPWPERSPMDQRLQLVQDYRSGLFTMTELAEQYGISRKTGYKWIGRTAGDGGVARCADRSRRPHHSPGATDAAPRGDPRGPAATAPPLGGAENCWRWPRGSTRPSPRGRADRRCATHLTRRAAW